MAQKMMLNTLVIVDMVKVSVRGGLGSFFGFSSVRGKAGTLDFLK